MNTEADQIIACLTGGVVGYTISLTIYALVSIPGAVAVFCGLCVACISAVLVCVAIRLRIERQPPPKQ